MVRIVEKVDSYNGCGLGLSPVLRSHRLEEAFCSGTTMKTMTSLDRSYCSRQ